MPALPDHLRTTTSAPQGLPRRRLDWPTVILGGAAGLAIGYAWGHGKVAWGVEAAGIAEAVTVGTLAAVLLCAFGRPWVSVGTLLVALLWRLA